MTLSVSQVSGRCAKEDSALLQLARERATGSDGARNVAPMSRWKFSIPDAP